MTAPAWRPTLLAEVEARTRPVPVARDVQEVGGAVALCRRAFEARVGPCTGRSGEAALLWVQVEPILVALASHAARIDAGRVRP